MTHAAVIDTSVNPPTSRRASLKAATDHLHQQLDAMVAAYDLSNRTHYTRFLQASAAALISVEHLLETAGVERLLPDWAARRRTQAILDDMAQFQVTIKPYQLRRAPPSDAEMFGMLYVLEGSRIGGNVLLKRVLATQPADTKHAAIAYLTAGTAHQWRSFLEVLENHPAAADQAASNGAAIYTFAIFQRSFANAARVESAQTAI